MPIGSSATATSASGSSSSLITRLKARDADAWRRLTRLYGPLVFRWARIAGLQDGDATDVVQEVFQAVAQHIDGFRRDRPGDSFRGWLWSIARNKVRDLYRLRASEPAAVGGSSFAQQVESLPERPPDQSLSSEVRELAQRALALIQTDFHDSTWRAFWRTAVDGQPAAESIARFLQLLELYRARSRPGLLKTLLQSLIEEIHYQQDLARQYPSVNERDARWNTVLEVVQAMEEYEKTAKTPSLRGFLDDVTLDPRDDHGDKEKKLQRDAVMLMTLHSAKGL